MLHTPSRSCHYTELKDAPPTSKLFHEWHTYITELPRLLAEGLEGKFVLIKGTEIIGIFESREAARDVGLDRFLRQAMLIQQVREYEPIYRTR
jgi:hypothetical protein